MSVIDQAPIARQVTTAKGSTWPRWNTCHNHCSWLRTLAMSVQALAGASFAGSTRLVLGNEAHANTFAKKKFCNDTPGCKLENDKCVTIPPQAYNTCWLQGLPPASNSKAGCMMLSKHTNLGCSWINGWGCKQGLDQGQVVGNRICRSDFKPCLKDWRSNGTKWAVCANETDCVNKYHGKVIH
mmetsp:Transcript_12752/g.20624  ORF Transcript_12752/g.20624 Transcript_12752/m.20624 type:complete len:183 (+) Transcript_12752:90-638(+)